MFCISWLRWSAWGLLTAALVGCAGTRSMNEESAGALLATSNYQAFAGQYLDARGQPKYDKSNLLDLLEAGKAFNDAGMWEQSRDAFQLAGQILSWKEDTIDTPQEVGSLMVTTLTSDAFGPYQGKIHQGLLIDYYQAINHLMLGRESDARVDFNRLQVRQDNAVRQLAAYEISVRESVATGLRDERSVGARDSLGEVGPSIADGVRDLPSDLQQTRIRLASGDILSAVFRSTSSAQADKQSNLSLEMARSARQAAATRGGNAMAAYLERELRNKRGTLTNKVLVVYEDGVGPSFNEFRIDLPLFLLTDKVTYTGIALPQFVRGTPAFGSLKVGKGKAVGETMILSDMNSLVGLEFDVAYRGIVTKAVISTTIKTAAQMAINQQIDGAAGNSLMGSLLKLGTGALQAATTRADTRAWVNLPNTIQMAVLDVPADGRLEIFSAAGAPLAKVEIPASQNSLVLIKASGTQGPPAIYHQLLPAIEPVESANVPIIQTQGNVNEKA